MPHRLRVLELFCGIGGCAAAVGDRAHVVAAVDINSVAVAAYRRNSPSPPLHVRTIESLPAAWYGDLNAELWWLSPPCQPYTSRGRRRDLHDDRAQGLLAVIERIAELRPRYVGLENVAGFQGSQSHQRLRATLDACGYQVREQILCPIQLGIPNRRPRFYLVASRAGRLVDQAGPSWSEVPRPAAWRFPVRQILDSAPADTLWMSDEFHERFRGAVHVVDAADPHAETHCFTSSYGTSVVRSGSYLATPRGVRRFSPTEILRLLCFPAGFRLPDELPLRKAWQLVGNSLSVAAVRQVLAAIPELGGLALDATLDLAGAGSQPAFRL